MALLDSMGDLAANLATAPSPDPGFSALIPAPSVVNHDAAAAAAAPTAKEGDRGHESGSGSGSAGGKRSRANATAGKGDGEAKKAKAKKGTAGHPGETSDGEEYQAYIIERLTLDGPLAATDLPERRAIRGRPRRHSASDGDGGDSESLGSEPATPGDDIAADGGGSGGSGGGGGGGGGGRRKRRVSERDGPDQGSGDAGEGAEADAKRSRGMLDLYPRRRNRNKVERFTPA